MNESYDPLPQSYLEIQKATEESGFNMASDLEACSLLRTLAVTKPGGKFLELGTGTGLSTAWILDGMDENAMLTSIDFDDSVLSIARKFLGSDPRLKLELIDGEKWVESNRDSRFDYIFADTWHGKYLLLDEVLEMLKIGGFYIVDDMLPQPNWPEGHAEKAEKFVKKLESYPFLNITKLNWSTGIIVATRKY
ncbi:Predicted O-methyltransferase YrrM [Algoriphagus alkaliphilus]|uniref:Predicted O-methyltransferase YrrM n=1 Tax=Algoriphagus alkaliphilus TaxID=279824 RepID=A0A1G5VBG5_9BACT|nr:class I SAM-dependent methyltransferase [Algoriphagus alkaliphilus]MBA4298876.1 methyltransferase domain-containing protein [Cyclobacterium sp.]SDA43018.1 Predicted O-methyltransferase YrrM [Algoriphagus alkaliphilus]